MTIRSVSLAFLAGLLLAVSASAQSSPTAQAFEHYEAIRAALAQDSVADIAKHATALAPLAEQVGGASVRSAAQQLASAKTLADARKHFGTLSEALVPKFVEAKLPGVQGFSCPMADNKPWVQRGKEIQNPYLGKSMLDCGAPIAPKSTSSGKSP
jgi:hypothetical protein